MDHEDHEARIGSLLADVPQFKEWIQAVCGLTTDLQGRTVILGLDAAETEEMILLRATDIRGARFQALRRKHDAARRRVTANATASKPRVTSTPVAGAFDPDRA